MLSDCVSILLQLCTSGYFPNSEQDLCIKCPAGHECIDPAIDPQPCPSGFYSLDAVSSCFPCPAGYSCFNTSSLPVLCKQGSYSYNASVECIECHLGTYCPSNALTSPLSCPNGTLKHDRCLFVCGLPSRS